MDITDLKQVGEVIDHIRPAYVINCAAFTDVDACESQRKLAWSVNAEGPRNLALTTKKYGSHLLHISTDYVFDGMRKLPQPYIESDETNPASYYGATKVEGERAIRGATDRYTIVRTAWMYGVQGRNFPKTMLRLACNDPEREIKVVADQYGSPTWSYTLALQIETLITRGGRGIYHATAEGYCTWYELACYFLERVGVPHRVIPCTSAEYPTPAERPGNSILENARLKEMGMNIMNTWQCDIDRYVDTFHERLLSEAGETKTSDGRADQR
jgi:dTDP-4-dehydrorhamnose reductase